MKTFLTFLMAIILGCYNAFAKEDYAKMINSYIHSDKELSLLYQQELLGLKEHLLSKRGGSITFLEDATFKSTDFSKGMYFFWSPYDDKGGLREAKHGRIEYIVTSRDITIDGIKWWGDSRPREHSIVFIQEITPEKIIVKSGFLAEETLINGKKYPKHTFVCFNEKREVIYSMELDLTDHTYLNYSECNVRIFRSKKPVTLEGVSFLPGSDIKFDKEGKWNFIRMKAGQEFQGKVYKDGGVLSRGEYSNLPNGKLEILTPDMENYPH